MVFTGDGEKYRNKVIKDYINVSVVVDIELGIQQNKIYKEGYWITTVSLSYVWAFRNERLFFYPKS